jgi:type I restriction-modification system DNA methylase subunit
MAKVRRRDSSSAAPLGFEAKLWAAADALRNNMDAAEYKHVVLGLIFLKYISDAFEAKHAELESQRAEGAEPEDPDEYRAASIFWVPREARWQHLKANAPQPTVGTLVAWSEGCRSIDSRGVSHPSIRRSRARRSAPGAMPGGATWYARASIATGALPRSWSPPAIRWFGSGIRDPRLRG